MVFNFTKKWWKKLKILSKKLNRSVELEKKIEVLCSFNYAKCEFIQGRILSIDKTNVSFVEAHRINIKVKDKQIILLYYDKDNLFLYDRSYPITLEQLIILLKELRKC